MPRPRCISRLRQDRRRRVRPRAARARRRARSRPAAPRKLLADAGLPVTEVAELHRLSRDARRPRQDAAPARPRRPARAARHCRRTWRRWSSTASRRSTCWSSTSIRSRQTIAQPDCTLDEAIENIDIGGPAMVRSAAKNWTGRRGGDRRRRSTPACSPSCEATARSTRATRFALAVDGVRPHRQLRRRDQRLPVVAAPARATAAPAREFPAQSNVQLRQAAGPALRREPAPERRVLPRPASAAPGSLVTATQLQGKELSYNNIADADAAWECVKSFDDAGAASSSSTPTRAASRVGADAAEAYGKAFKTDPTSAFGGIIAFNRAVDGAAAAARCRSSSSRC